MLWSSAQRTLGHQGVTGWDFFRGIFRVTDVRRPLLLSALVLFLITSGLTDCFGENKTDLDRGLELYYKNRLEEALPLVEDAAENEPSNADAHAWLGETYRRLKQTEKAVSAARKAIAIEPCHSFAHTVLADALSPLYGSWEGVDFDSTWNHLLKAVECDSTDGNAWLDIWCEAIRRGEEKLEKRALRSVLETGFLTPAVLEYNRWMLRHLPANGLLLTNGDMDTYPAVALQEVERFREDVVVVNRSLLNTVWYARFIRDRYGIPLPVTDDELDALSPYTDEDGNRVLVSKQILNGWLRMARESALANPIAISVTVSSEAIENVKGNLVFAGPFWRWTPDSAEVDFDEYTALKSISSVKSQHLAGPFVSAADRSPVRRMFTNGLVRNVTSLALRYSESLIESGRKSEALLMLNWAEEFETQTELGPFFTEQIEALKEAASE